MKYFGKVFIYFGSKTGLSTTPNITLHYEDESQYTNFGFTVNSCGDRLLVSSPFDSEQKGLLQLISGSHNNKIFKVTSAQNFSWFGYSTACKIMDDFDLLFVGSPMYR